MIRNLILDWSGTLADDLGAVLTGTNRVLEHFGRTALSREEFRNFFRLPYTEFYSELLPGVDLKDLQAAYLALFPVDHPVPLLPHAEDFLRQAGDSGRRLFVCSSAPDDHVRAQAQANGVLDWFEELHCGVIDKVEHVHAMLERHGMAATETVFVGDMRHDIDAGRAAGLTTVATATGYESVSLLLTAEPDILVRDLSHLTRLLTPLAA
jgi:phosphoglycolate phosphatase